MRRRPGVQGGHRADTPSVRHHDPPGCAGADGPKGNSMTTSAVTTTLDHALIDVPCRAQRPGGGGRRPRHRPGVHHRAPDRRLPVRAGDDVPPRSRPRSDTGAGAHCQAGPSVGAVLRSPDPLEVHGPDGPDSTAIPVPGDRGIRLWKTLPGGKSNVPCRARWTYQGTDVLEGALRSVYRWRNRCRRRAPGRGRRHREDAALIDEFRSAPDRRGCWWPPAPASR